MTLESETESVGVSVVIPVYNRREPLLYSIDSVQSTRPDKVEIIVVDDCSSSPISDFLPSSNIHGIRIRCFRFGRNRGPQAARNLGIRRARFELIAFLDSDDHFCPDKLDRLLEIYQREPFDLAAHRQIELPKGHALLSGWSRVRHFVPFQWLLALSNPVQTSALVVRRRRLLGPPSMRHCEDYAFLVNFCSRGVRAVYVPEVLGGMGRPQGAAGGLSAAAWKMRKGEFKARQLWWRRPSIGSALKIAVGAAFGTLRFVLDLLRGRYGPLADRGGAAGRNAS